MRRLVVVDALLALGLGALVVALSAGTGVGGPPQLLQIALLLVAVTLRRAVPLAAMALAVAAGLVQAASLSVAEPIDVAYVPLCLAFGASASVVVRRLGVLCAVGGTVAAAVVALLLLGTADLRDSGLTIVLVTATAALLTLGPYTVGQLQRSRAENLRIAVQAEVAAVERRRLAEAYEQQAERSRIAADMHDLVAHSWAVVAAQATGARYARTPAAAEQALDVIADTARTAMADLNTILQRLRRSDDQAVPGASEGAYGPTYDAEQDQRLLDRMRASGMTLQVDDDGGASGSPWLRQTVHHLEREALTNALKHADLTRPVTLRRERGAEVVIEIRSRLREDGPPASGTGHGLLGMRERAAAVGGHLTAGPDGETWVVRARLPRREGSS